MVSRKALLPLRRHRPRTQINAKQSLTQHILLLPLELSSSQPNEFPSARNEAWANEGRGEAVVLRLEEGDGDVVLCEGVGVEAAFVEGRELGRLGRGAPEEGERPGGAEVVGEGEVVTG